MIFAFLGPQVGRFWDVFGKKNAVLRGFFHQSMIFSREKTPFWVFFSRNTHFLVNSMIVSREKTPFWDFFSRKTHFLVNTLGEFGGFAGKNECFFRALGAQKIDFLAPKGVPRGKKAIFFCFL